MTLHFFHSPISDTALPERFTYPFCYTPHPLCVQASEEVRTYLSSRTEWHDELQNGKMFGVLVVRTPDGRIGYLAAYSGTLDGRNDLPYFVPAVYDMLRPEGFFRREEALISQINLKIGQMEHSEDYRSANQAVESAEQAATEELSALKEDLRTAKSQRDERRRAGGIPPEEEERMIRESQHRKAEYKRRERHWKTLLADLRARATGFEQEIVRMKEERRNRSARLQQQLFERFEVENARGERTNLSVLFAQTVHKTPPAGAGECAAPKLLQYAYKNGLHPLAMAEFWWGNSPKTEIRHHGHFYPSCKGKCEPILNFMLRGLEVEENPMRVKMMNFLGELTTLYEDEWIVVVNKPAGMLSVRGKQAGVESVEEVMMRRYPEAKGPMIVHRLDMATSGLLIITKTRQVHRALQEQFKRREIRKRYIALLDGHPARHEGIITLPLTPDPMDRPRQIVDNQHGKPAVTRFETLSEEGGFTRMALYPITGRTHQLRVHMAHPQGLHCPIVGDELYGHPARRLMLHAESVEFRHPISGQMIRLECPPEF